MFVTLSTALVVLVSYTPLAPKMLFILFTLGFAFAIPAYIFLLPQMTHWVELAAFLFGYAFIGFYVFAGPISIFFLLGLMTLGIQNTMNYNFAVLLSIILLFYLICTNLIVTEYFPFTSKPQLLYASFRRRFFGEKVTAVRLGIATSLIAKMRLWVAMIDSHYFPDNPPEKIAALNHACAVLLEQLKILASRDDTSRDNGLIARAREKTDNALLARLCKTLATHPQEAAITATLGAPNGQRDDIETRLGESLGQDYLEIYDINELTEFYLYINLQAFIHAGLVDCRETLAALDWSQLQGKKF